MFRFATFKVNTPQLPKFKPNSSKLEIFKKHFQQQAEIFRMPLTGRLKSMLYFSLYCRSLAIVYNQKDNNNSAIPVKQFRHLKKTMRAFLYNIPENQRINYFTSFSFSNFCRFLMKYPLQGDEQDLSIELNRYLQKITKQPSIFKPNENHLIEEMIKSYRDFLILKAIPFPETRQKQTPLKIRPIPNKDDILFERSANFSGVLNKKYINQLFENYSIRISKVQQRGLLRNLHISHPDRIAFDINLNGITRKIRIIGTEVLSISKQLNNSQKIQIFSQQLAQLKKQLSKSFDSIIIQSDNEKENSYFELDFSKEQALETFFNGFQYKSLGLVYQNLQKDIDVESSLILNLQKYCKKAYIYRLDTKQHIRRSTLSNNQLNHLRDQFIYLKAVNFHHRLYLQAVSNQSENYIKYPAQLDDFHFIGQSYQHKETQIFAPQKTTVDRIVELVQKSEFKTVCILVRPNKLYTSFKYFMQYLNKNLEKKPASQSKSTLQMMNKHAIYSVLYSKNYSNEEIKLQYPNFQIERYNKIYKTYQKIMLDPQLEISRK